jgi:hypothetical protein
MSVPSKRKPWLPLLVLWLCASCGAHIPSSSPGLAAREGYVDAGGGEATTREPARSVEDA